MSGEWSSVPSREQGHPTDAADDLEARLDPASPAAAPADGRVHGRPAPQYGEYAPEGWVNPVLVEQERREQQDRARALREQEEAARAPRSGTGTPRAPGGVAGATPTASRFGASPLDVLLTVGLLGIGLWSVVEALSVSTTASIIRTVVEQQYTDLANPAALSTAVLVRALVLVVVFVLVVWWSIRRLRARRWTFWVPLLGGLVGTVLGMVPVMIVIFHDPHFAAYMQRMAGG